MRSSLFYMERSLHAGESSIWAADGESWWLNGQRTGTQDRMKQGSWFDTHDAQLHFSLCSLQLDLLGEYLTI